MGTAGGHDPPYPATGEEDPRPFWARQWMRSTDREIASMKKTLGEMDTKLDVLLTDKATRDGVNITWRRLGLGMAGLAGMATVIGVLFGILTRLPG